MVSHFIRSLFKVPGCKLDRFPEVTHIPFPSLLSHVVLIALLGGGHVVTIILLDAEWAT